MLLSLGLSLSQQRGGSGLSWPDTVTHLYNATNMATLFQDDAGTTPVTAAGLDVALMTPEIGTGNFAQTTSGERPTMARLPATGRNNRFVSTEDMTGPQWFTLGDTTVSETEATVPTGGSGNPVRYSSAVLGPSGVEQTFSFYARSVSGSTSLTCDLGNAEWKAFTLTSTLKRFNFTVTPGGDRTWLDFQLAGAGVVEITMVQAVLGADELPYQKVVDENDVTEAGVKDVYCARFDGVNDNMLGDIPAETTDIFIALLRDPAADKAMLLSADGVSTHYIGALEDGSSSTTMSNNAGSPAFEVDEVAADTQNNLHDAVSTNAFEVLHIDGVDASDADWRDAVLGGYDTAGYEAEMYVAAIVFAASPSAADVAAIKANLATITGTSA